MYKMKDKPMSKMKGDGKSGMSNEAIAKAGGTSPNRESAATMSSPSGKPEKQ